MAIDVYGATWCGDCRQAKNTLDELGAAYIWHNIEEEDGAADRRHRAILDSERI